MKSGVRFEWKKGDRVLGGHEDTPLYTIGVASRLLDCEMSALRRYEKAGLIEPCRSEGNTRLYTENQLEKLREIRDLMEKDKVNVAGVRMIIELRGMVEKLQEEVTSLREEKEAFNAKLAGTQGAGKREG